MKLGKIVDYRYNPFKGNGEVTVEVKQDFFGEMMRMAGHEGMYPHLMNLLSCESSEKYRPERVIFNEPATIVYWNDGTKTVVMCDPMDTYNKEAGLAMCFMKKMCGSSRTFNDTLRKWTEDV